MEKQIINGRNSLKSIDVYTEVISKLTSSDKSVAYVSTRKVDSIKNDIKEMFDLDVTVIALKNDMKLISLK